MKTTQLLHRIGQNKLFPTPFLQQLSDFLCADWSRAMVDKTSTDFGNGMTVAQFVFTFLSCVTFWWETSAEINFKNIQHYVKKDQQKNLSLSVLLSIIEMTSKCSKLCNETTCLRLLAPLDFWLFWCHFLMVDKSADHGNLFSICFCENF